MIPIRKENTLTQHGPVQSSANMSIRATPEMFDLLSQGLYKNPIQAVVREYLANAVDESKEVEVTFPNSWTPYFKVRDYGKGMSSSFVLQLFSSYGFSDKQTTNDQIGGFGVGSKSGFAYTDSFTVRSIHEGLSSTYECTRSPKGEFVISMRGQKTTRDPSGVEIIIPVKKHDFEKFNKWINHYCGYLTQFRGIDFKGFATVKCYEKITDELYYVDGDNATAYNYSSYRQDQPCYVVMGGIPYELPNTSDIFSGGQSEILEAGSKTLIFSLPIGSIEITASREQVRLSQHTNDVIKPIIDRAVQDKVKHHVEALIKLSTEWEKFKYTLKNINNIYKHVPGSVGKVVVSGNVRELTRKGNLAQLSRYRWRNKDEVTFNRAQIEDNIRRIIIDCDKNIPSRLKRVLHDHGYKEPYYDGLMLVSDTDTQEWDDYGIPYEKLSDYEPLRMARAAGTQQKGSRGVTKGKALVVYYLNGQWGSYYDQGLFSTETLIDLDSVDPDVYYYDRKTEHDEVRAALKVLDYFVPSTNRPKVISATAKNLSKVSSCIPHIRTYINNFNSSYNKELLRDSYIYEYYKDELPKRFKYHELLNLSSLEGAPSISNYSWENGGHLRVSPTRVSFEDIQRILPALAKTVDKAAVEAHFKEMERTIKAMRDIKLNGVLMYDYIRWDRVDDYKKLLDL